MEKAIENVLTRCRGRNAREVLSNAAKLNSKERLTLIKHFGIEPKKLADTIVYFWLHANKGIASSGGDNPNIMGSE